MRELSYNPLWEKLIDLKMTKTDLAEKAGISRSTIAKMRKDEPVNLDVVIKVANALDCDVVDIISILPAAASPTEQQQLLTKTPESTIIVPMAVMEGKV